MSFFKCCVGADPRAAQDDSRPASATLSRRGGAHSAFASDGGASKRKMKLPTEVFFDPTKPDGQLSSITDAANSMRDVVDMKKRRDTRDRASSTREGRKLSTKVSGGAIMASADDNNNSKNNNNNNNNNTQQQQQQQQQLNVITSNNNSNNTLNNNNNNTTSNNNKNPLITPKNHPRHQHSSSNIANNTKNNTSGNLTSSQHHSLAPHTSINNNNHHHHSSSHHHHHHHHKTDLDAQDNNGLTRGQNFMKVEKWLRNSCMYTQIDITPREIKNIEDSPAELPDNIADPPSEKDRLPPALINANSSSIPTASR